MSTSAVMIPWVADASSYDIRVKIDSTTETITVSFTEGRQYWRSGDGTADSSAGNGDLLGVVVDAINANHTDGGNVSAEVVFVSDEPRVQLAESSSDIKLLWSDAATTFPPGALGFTSSDTSEAATVTAPNRLPGLWTPQALLTDDTRDRYMPRRGVRESLSGLIYGSDFGDGFSRREVSWTLLQQRYVLNEYEQTDGEAFEDYWVDWISKGRRFRLYDEASTATLNAGTFSAYKSRRNGEDPAERDERDPTRWSVFLEMRST